MRPASKKIKLRAKIISILNYLDDHFGHIAILLWGIVALFTQKPNYQARALRSILKQRSLGIAESIFERTLGRLSHQQISAPTVHRLLETSEYLGRYDSTIALFSSALKSNKVNKWISGFFKVEEIGTNCPSLDRNLIYPAHTYRFTNPKVFGENSKKTSFEVEIAATELWVINDIQVVGSFILLKNETILNYEPAAHPSNGFVAGTWHYLIGVKNEPNTGILSFFYEEERTLNEAILISGRCSTNYFHWLIEYLPKFLAVDLSNIDQSVPVIVDAELLPQQIESLKVFSKGRQIFFYDHKTLLHVKKLYVPSTHTFHPDRLDIPFWKGSGLSIEHINFLRTGVASAFRISYEPRVNRNKIYLARKGARSLKNSDEIINVMQKEGFEIVYPESLTFQEQVQLFNSSALIVGPAGAAFSNIIFCRPGTKILSFVAKHNKEYCMQSNLAQCAGADYSFITGDPVVPRGKVLSDMDYMHVNYTISAKKVLSALQELI